MSMGALSNAAEDRPLRLRKRPDLTIQTSAFQQEKSWIIKDPISLEYRRLREAEYAVFAMLDGQSTLRMIRETLQAKYPTKKVRLADLQNLLSTFHRMGLVISDAPGQATQLLHRQREKDRRKVVGALSNVLAIRLPGFDPEPILSWLHPRFGWLFQPWFMLVWLVLTVGAGGLILTNYAEFQARLPEFQQFFSVQNVLLMAMVMAVTKGLHEFGHGLCCKHYGGECHEIGMMLLVFTPALYCDTSDSWLLPSKWQRAFIGAAGIYVEVLLASLATFLWWYSRPGTFHYICLNVMFVSSISTVVFNINPLLRYDGYYILSDILEIPNLAEKARLGLINQLRVHCLGLKPLRSAQLPRRGQFWFAFYSVASFLYRWFVLIMIVWFLHRMFEPYGLQIIGHMAIAVSFVGMVIMPIGKLVKFFSVPGRIQEVKLVRFLSSLIVLALIVAGILIMPLPHRVWSTLVVRPDTPQHVYVSAPGRLTEVMVKAGDQVEPGAVLARLESPQLRLRIAETEAKVATEELKLQNLRLRMGSDPSAGAIIDSVRTSLGDLQQLLEQLNEDADRLVLKAERAGVVMLPPEQAAEPYSEDMPLPSWQGSPLDEENRGAFMVTGSLFCIIGDPNKMMATLMVKQGDVSLVEPGYPVRMVLDEYPDAVLSGEVRDVAKIDLSVPPRELVAAAGGGMATEPSAGGQEKPLFVTYEARVPLHDTSQKLLPGFRGRARIDVGHETLAARVKRFVQSTFYFR